MRLKKRIRGLKENEEKLALLLRIRDATPKDIFCDQDQEIQKILEELNLDDIETAELELDSLLN